MKSEKIVFRTHAVQRMFERSISTEDVHHVLETGSVIAYYSDDRPYPSFLMLGWCEARPIHIVAAENTTAGETIVITVYEPDASQWTEDFRRRRI